MIKLLKKIWLMLLAWGFIVVLPGCSATVSPTPELTPITVQLTWTHSAQFAGFYAADQNGDYAAEGLAVTFIEGGPTVDRLTPVLNGEAQFGLAGGVQLIPARAGGKHIRAVATILRRDPFAFFALVESGITRPEDFVGKTLWLPPQALPYLQAMTARVGVTPDQYTVIDDANFTSLYSGEIDVAVGFVTSQGVEAQRAGYNLNIIYPDDYGVHLTSDNIFTTDDFIAANPELVTRFLRATFKGWTYAVEHPNEVGPLVAKYNPKADVSLETDQMIASLPLINTGQDYIGWMKPDVWAGMEQTLRAQGVLTRPVNVTEVYTMQFLQEIYGQ
jgi:NitT/TauT family transport system substrate-binding protein